MKLLFNSDPMTDWIALVALLDGMGLNPNNEKVIIDAGKIQSIVFGMRQDFPHNGGLDKASIFKKVGLFSIFFITQKPILSGVPSLIVSDEVSKIPNHINIIVALSIAFKILHKAPIHRGDGTIVTLDNEIQLSKHSFTDIIDAFSNTTPQDHFKMASVLFEQIAYKTNPACQYQPQII